MKYRYPIGMFLISFAICNAIYFTSGEKDIPNNIIMITFVIAIGWIACISIHKVLTGFKNFLFELIDKIKE